MALYVITILAILIAIFSWVHLRRAHRDFALLFQAVENWSIGNLAFDLPQTKYHQLAEKLERRIHHILQQRNEYKAVLSSMVEGVIAVDERQNIITINEAARHFLSVQQPKVEGSELCKVIDNKELCELVRMVIANRVRIERDITISGREQRIIQARGIILQNGAAAIIGGLVVINDVTRLRRLEKMRRDFVANVSHELKTPITSIKGFVETLLEGAMYHEQETERFLKIISRQADRLHYIIEDILTLSRIEQGAEQEEIVLVSTPIKEVLQNAIQTCELQARGKNTCLLLECEETLEGKINSQLLEQAIVNLIENAMKYSDSGKTVKIKTLQHHDKIAIAVQDEGCGIDSKHLPRLFERFYRVDKARSRKLGGTGLGLAIVKHIALAHKGEVQVESVPGTGSTFTIIVKSGQS